MKKIVLLLVVVASLFGARIEVDKETRCLIRNIKIYETPEWRASIQVRSGETVYFASPKSMFEFYFQPGKWPEYQVKREDDMRIHVTNFNTMEKIVAKEAYFMYGSSKIGPAGDDLPAFSTKQEAELFMKKFGGSRVLDFSQVTDGLINLLNGRTR